MIQHLALTLYLRSAGIQPQPLHDAYWTPIKNIEYFGGSEIIRDSFHLTLNLGSDTFTGCMAEGSIVVKTLPTLNGLNKVTIEISSAREYAEDTAFTEILEFRGFPEDLHLFKYGPGFRYRTVQSALEPGLGMGKLFEVNLSLRLEFFSQ